MLLSKQESAARAVYHGRNSMRPALYIPMPLMHPFMYSTSSQPSQLVKPRKLYSLDFIFMLIPKSEFAVLQSCAQNTETEILVTWAKYTQEVRSAVP